MLGQIGMALCCVVVWQSVLACHGVSLYFVFIRRTS